MKNFLIAIIIYSSGLFANSVKESLFDYHNITTISPKELMHFINTNQGQKPLFIFLSAENGGCKPCDHFNQTIAKVADKRAGDMEFVYVAFPHYQDVNNYPEIIEKFHILGMPTSLIIYKNKVLDSTFGNTKQQRIETTIDTALQKIGE